MRERVAPLAVLLVLVAGAVAHLAASRPQALEPRSVRRLDWPDGRPRLRAEVRGEVFDGAYRTWYPSGQPYERRHFANGQEAGLQQSWMADGALYLNYEVREGRRYGFVNAKPCTPVRVSR